MFQPEMLKEHWGTLQPKIRELWPSLTNQDAQEINGNFDALVTKVTAKYTITRDEILNKLAPFLPVTAARK